MFRCPKGEWRKISSRLALNKPMHRMLSVSPLWKRGPGGFDFSLHRARSSFTLALPAAGMRQARVCYQIITHLFIMKINLDIKEYHGKLKLCFHGPICSIESIKP